MKACVCFKIVSDLEKVIPSDWQVFDNVPDTSYVGTMIGCFDEIALEIALRLKDTDESIECIALTLGVLSPVLAKKIYAAGFDQVVCLDCVNSEFAPKQVAQKLSMYLSTLKPDLIITGKQSALMDSGTVPLYIAHTMKLPTITDVRNCSLMQDTLCIEHETDTGVTSTHVKMPIVLSVGNSDIFALRLATLSAQLAAGKKAVLHSAEENVQPLEHTFQKKEMHTCTFIKGDIPTQVGFITDLISKGSVL